MTSYLLVALEPDVVHKIVFALYLLAGAVGACMFMAGATFYSMWIGRREMREGFFSVKRSIDDLPSKTYQMVPVSPPGNAAGESAPPTRAA